MKKDFRALLGALLILEAGLLTGIKLIFPVSAQMPAAILLIIAAALTGFFAIQNITLHSGKESELQRSLLETALNQLTEENKSQQLKLCRNIEELQELQKDAANHQLAQFSTITKQLEHTCREVVLSGLERLQTCNTELVQQQNRVLQAAAEQSSSIFTQSTETLTSLISRQLETGLQQLNQTAEICMEQLNRTIGSGIEQLNQTTGSNIQWLNQTVETCMEQLNRTTGSNTQQLNQTVETCTKQLNQTIGSGIEQLNRTTENDTRQLHNAWKESSELLLEKTEQQNSSYMNRWMTFLEQYQQTFLEANAQAISKTQTDLLALFDRTQSQITNTQHALRSLADMLEESANSAKEWNSDRAQAEDNFLEELNSSIRTGNSRIRGTIEDELTRYTDVFSELKKELQQLSSAVKNNTDGFRLTLSTIEKYQNDLNQLTQADLEIMQKLLG